MVLGAAWIAVLSVLGDLVHPAIAPVWLAAGVLLALVVGWWMLRAWRAPTRVVTLACWWFVASIFGPAALVVALPWFRGFRSRSLDGIATGLTGERARWRWRVLVPALLWHMVAALTWIFVCGGLLGALFLPDNGPSPHSDLGLILFAVVPAALWLVAAGAIDWRLRASPRSPTDVALLVAGAWWAVSAIAAFTLVFSV